MQEVFEKTTDKLEHEKIKTNYAEIIIKNPLEKPYYAIVYFDLTDGELHEGFGSYCLEYVVEWKRDCFEIVDQVAEEYNGGWIPCSERLPEDGVNVLVWFEYYRYGDHNRLFQITGISYTFNGEWSGFVNGSSGWKNLKIIAWQPLPAPPKKEV